MAEDGDDNREHTWIRVNGEQKMFLEQEALRLRRERFARTRDLGRVTMAETVASLLTELRRLRDIVPDGEAPDVGVPPASPQAASNGHPKEAGSAAPPPEKEQG